jgi:hypothetical protein
MPWVTTEAPLPDDDEHRAAADERVSVTDVTGSVARFSMTYSPVAGDRRKFGPPLSSRIPSALYLVAAMVLGGIVLYAYLLAPSSSRIFEWVVGRDRDRPVSASVLAVVIVVSAIGTVVRTHMRGVVLSEDWIETRRVLPLGIPRARRWAWVQVLRVVLDDSRVALELWDGSFERLPDVARREDMVRMVIGHAQRRRIDITSLATPPR